MVEITNRSNSGELKYTDANYEMAGDFRQDPSTNNVITLNLIVNKINDGFMGNVNGYMENGELKFNMNQIPLAEMASIVTAIANCINEIKEGTV